MSVDIPLILYAVMTCIWTDLPVRGSGVMSDVDWSCNECKLSIRHGNVQKEVQSVHINIDCPY